MLKSSMISLVFFLSVGMALAGNQAQGGRVTLAGSADRSIAGSIVSCSPDDLNGCSYTAGSTVAIEFRVSNLSDDEEWLDIVSLEFPVGWTVACNSQDATGSTGNTVSMDCAVSGTTVSYTDNDGGYGEIYDNSTWDFTIDVTAPASTIGPQLVNWTLSGDDYGADPHDVTGSTSIVPVELISFSVE